MKDGDVTLSELKLTVHVKNRTLPVPSEWAFHLDLWQNPYAVARYYGVEPFSEEHFDLMLPADEIICRCRRESDYHSIMHKPWNGQTYVLLKVW